VNRAKTKVSQKETEDIAEKITTFCSYLTSTSREIVGLTASRVINMDETPVYLDMVGNHTMEVKGAKEVNLKTTGAEKQRVTVVLACSMDGGKLPPMVIFKGVSTGRGRIEKEFSDRTKHGYPLDVSLSVQENAWMNEGQMTLWFERCWARRDGGLSKKESILIMDSFEGRQSTLILVRNTIKHVHI